MFYTLCTLFTLFTALNALTVTFPTTGSSVDPSKLLTIIWTSTSSDPATVNIFVNAASSNLYNFGDGKLQVGTNVATSAGSLTVQPNTLYGFGSGYTVTVLSTSGDNLATSGSFLLAYGASESATVTGATSTQHGLSSMTSGISGQSLTATSLSSANATYTSTRSHLSVTGANNSTASLTTHSSSITTHTSSLTSSSVSSAAATSTNIAHPRIGGDKEVWGTLALLAGLFAVAV